jgi:hypothetical protein
MPLFILQESSAYHDNLSTQCACASQTGFEDKTIGTNKISNAEPRINLSQPEPDLHEME